MATKKSSQKSQKNLQSEQNKLRYYERKRLVIQKERRNYKYLILFKGSNNWWKAINKSAVYLALDISPKISSNIRLLEDSDYEFKAEFTASTHSIEDLTRKMAVLGIDLIDETDDVRTYALKDNYTANQYNLLIENHKSDITRTEDLILPHKLMPNLLEDLKELQHSVFYEIRKLDAASRELIGTDFSKTISHMIIKYTKIARNTQSDAKAYLREALDDIETVNGFCHALDSLRLPITERKMFEFQRLISKTRDQIIFEMKREGMKDIDKLFKGEKK